MAQILMTQRGLTNLIKEKEEIEKVKIPKCNFHLQKAREQGDLSENSAYHTAREEREFLESRLRKLEETIKNASLIGTKNNNSGKVQIGSAVTINNGKEKITYTIVGEFESCPQEKKISYKSALGGALINHKVNDEVSYEIQKGKITLKILSVN